MTKAPVEAEIVIRFTSWWLGGTGKTGGAAVDMVAYRDGDLCPALPMTQVKGVLRQTAEDFGLFEDGKELDRFFGERTQEGVTADAGGAAIRFAGAAQMRKDERRWFNANPDARAELFSIMRATAIDEALGVAETDTLRSIEVAVPVTLTRNIQWVDGEPPENWVNMLDRVCAFTPAFGKLRADGYGRAIAHCRPVAAR